MTLDLKYIPMYNTPKIQEELLFEIGDRVFVLPTKEIDIIGFIYPEDAFELSLSECRESKKDLMLILTTDQMAEMWGEVNPNKDAYDFIGYLDEFKRKGFHKDWWNPDWPLPIIVLAFIMDDLHGLRWDEKEGWV